MVRAAPTFRGRNRKSGRAIAKIFVSPVGFDSHTTFNPNEKFLAAAVESVIAQVYENWELILIDDGSDMTGVAALLEKMRQSDARIQTGSQVHGGISSALNAGLALAKGEWIALLDHDDLLETDAL